MKVAVVGAGLMGPAIALDCLESGEVKEILLLDIDEGKLKRAWEKLGRPKKLKTAIQDVTDRRGFVEAIKGYDVLGIALLRWLNVEAMWGAIEAGVHAVDLSSPPKGDWPRIDEAAKKADVTIIPGCGVEPGLTDILAAHGMELLDKVERVDIFCGGIPRHPEPPFKYKIVFGGRYLPLRPGMVKVIKNGEECYVKRYTVAEPITFEGVEEELETFYDGFPEVLYELEKFREVKWCSEKTVRYKGYCEKVNFLDWCGLLGREAIEFKGQSLIPFQVFSEIIYPKVKMKEGESDITVLRVIVSGLKEGVQTTYTYDMVDYYDEEKQVTSMAKTTGYTAAIVMRMIGRGDITERGLIPTVKAIKGELFHRLVEELRRSGVEIKEIIATKKTL
jgi:lysine 6-dehydrogenase